MFVCKLENNCIYNSLMSISETGDVSMDLDEQSIGEPVPGHDFTVDHEAAKITFQLVEQGTKWGKARLVDSLGYTYNLHHRRSYTAYLQCTVRPKGNPCRAAKIVTKVKAKAVQEKFRSAAAIVDEVSVLTLR